jgi:mono/diheme cytochrome c family protein
METRKIRCPSCEVSLRIAETLPVGKKISCPKCEAGFRVPDEDEQPERRAVSARPRKAAPPPEEEDDWEEERERRPVKRKRKKKSKKAASNLPLILGLSIGGGVLLIGTAVALAVMRPWESKSTAVASTNTPTAPAKAATNESPAPSGIVAPGLNETKRGANPAATAPTNVATGKQIYDSLDCSRCHAIGNAAGGMGRKGSNGPNLSRVGADPRHTVEWLSEHIRNPKSHRPNSRMPRYEEKINPEDLRSLAEYLSSLK